ncbi:hypothetical protein D3C87_1528620 [compost metagenome]
MVCRVGRQDQALAGGFDVEDHVARRVAESCHAGDAGDDIGAITDEGDLFGKRLDVGKHALVPTFGRCADTCSIAPEIVFLLADDITGILEGRFSIFHQAADMVAV